MRPVLLSSGRTTKAVRELRQRQVRPQPTAASAATSARPRPSSLWQPVRSALLAPLRAAPEESHIETPAPAGKSASAGSGAATAPYEGEQMPRPPTGMSGGSRGGDVGQSELAATAAAEATVAEAAAALQQQQQPPSYKISDFRSNPRVGGAPDASATAEAVVATAETEVAAAAAEAHAAVTAAEAAAAHLHAAGRSIDALRTQPHEFSCEQPSTAGGTIVVAVDDTDDAAAAVDWVAKNLYTPGVDELRVVHVVCDPRTLQWQTSLGTSAGGRPISLSSLDLGLGAAPGRGSFGGEEVDLHDYLGRLNAAAEQVVARRCDGLRQRDIKYEVELPRLPAARSAAGIAETLLESVRRNAAKLLVVASHGPGALAEYGSVSRFCYQHSSVPLLLMPSSETQAAASAEAARRAAPLAAPPAAAAAAAPVAGEAPAAPAPPSASPSPTGSEILLVVNHLEELANVWQWVADNCAQKGDSLAIWHVAGPSLSGMPSLPTAIANQMRRRGLGDVSYHSLYSATGDPQDLGEQVCHLAAASPAVKLVVLLNYTQRGLIQEALHGSVASHLTRHCTKPLLLLQLPE